ncbi:expressed unknown protein [Ectocarpus siliculosus]|uniref:Uncharacterized protein n=1 Tax=Ectocarpus siliculosus TaxID=2880 RepID=D8LKN9_ECTSI|nr:expressed unknown protein [Ectocarpus siliculosus]|eukprot:CBN79638.1 expressed unknown protein [Ectocarpus siliculosus]
MACLYSCRHPLWGGTGTCSEQDDLIGYECSCDDDGFTSMDSFGNPSCVLRRALVAGYIIIAVCGSSTVGFLAWNALKQSHLPRTAQATRRAMLRLRLIWSASAYSGSASIIFCVAAADGGLYANGLKALCSITFPLVCMAVAHMIDLWINTLPTQLVPADSVAIKVIKLAEKKNLCLWVGWLAIAGLTPFGLLTFFVLDVIKVVRAVNLVICFNFVGVNLTKIINGAKRNAGPSSIAFYEQAIHTLRIQVFALTVAGVVWIVMVVALEPYLGGVGARTPVIPFTIMLLDAFVGFSLAVHFAKIGPTSRQSFNPLNQLGTQMNSAASPWGGARAILSDVGAKASEVMSMLAAPTEKRVVPVTTPPRGSC